MSELSKNKKLAIILLIRLGLCLAIGLTIVRKLQYTVPIVPFRSVQPLFGL